LGVIGAGNYAKSMIFPNFASLPNLSLEAICTARGMNAESLASRYGFRRASTSSADVIADPEINAIAIATRHDSHARLTLEALLAGKHVYVEKPLALNSAELAPILELLGGRGTDGPTLWIGHNRRFSPLSQRALDYMKDVPIRQVSCTVRSAGVPADSWYLDPQEGGGLLFGDVCHFIDLGVGFQNSALIEVHAFSTPDAGHREESWAIQMRFEDGSISTVHYVCGSERGWEREVVDILGGGRSARISGFRRLELRGASKARGESKLQPDLGQRAMLERMMAQFSRAPGSVDDTERFVRSAQALLAAQRSILERRVVLMDREFPYSLR
ncbi:MAG: Gfo/Idh/MocA family protein, partial [Candidatus Eiseniibacteriota bacterium]